MIRINPVRNPPPRIAYCVRAGVFLVGVLGGAVAQKPRMLPPPPKRANVQPARQAPAQAPAPIVRPANTPPPVTGGTQLVSPGHPAQTQQHLPEWMEAHRNMPLAEQQRALESEPGFREQAPEEQQRLRQQLNQLNRMAPDKLNQRVQFAETMEKFAPAQRQQVRNVLGQLGSLPEDRQHAVHRAYLQLRDMSVPDRQAYMNSPQFRGQFSDQERATVGNMVNAAPLLRSFEPPSTPKE